MKSKNKKEKPSIIRIKGESFVPVNGSKPVLINGKYYIPIIKYQNKSKGNNKTKKNQSKKNN